MKFYTALSVVRTLHPSKLSADRQTHTHTALHIQQNLKSPSASLSALAYIYLTSTSTEDTLSYHMQMLYANIFQ